MLAHIYLLRPFKRFLEDRRRTLNPNEASPTAEGRPKRKRGRPRKEDAEAWMHAFRSSWWLERKFDSRHVIHTLRATCRGTGVVDCGRLWPFHFRFRIHNQACSLVVHFGIRSAIRACQDIGSAKTEFSTSHRLATAVELSCSLSLSARNLHGLCPSRKRVMTSFDWKSPADSDTPAMK